MVITETEGREIIEGLILLAASVSNYLKARTALLKSESAKQLAGKASTTAEVARTRAEDAKQAADLSHAATLINSDRIHRMENGGTTEKIRAYLASVNLWPPNDTTNSTMPQEGITHDRPDSTGETGDNPGINPTGADGSQGAARPLIHGDTW